MINSVYIVDYDSLTWAGGGLNGYYQKIIGRKRESMLFDNKIDLLDFLKKITSDKCIENIEVSISELNRNKLDLQNLLNG
jgi:hypothetical protein